MIWDSVSDLLPGLLPASWRGVQYYMPDTSIEPGRRIAEHLFPGMDRAAFDDMGLSPQIVVVAGLVIGDDYIAQAKALESAFETPGPGTLIHPWLGGMKVILESPASISFSASELRVARFSATFIKIGKGAGAVAGRSSISTLLNAASSIIQASKNLIKSADRQTISIAGRKATERSNRLLREAYAASLEPEIVQRASRFETSPVDGADFASRMNSVTDELFDATPEWGGISPVAPAEEAILPITHGLLANKAVDALLVISSALAIEAAKAPSGVDQAMLMASAAHNWGVALKLSTVVDHEVRDSALKLRQTISDSAELFEPVLSPLSATAHVAASSQLARDLAAAGAAAHGDINEAIGRLPRVIRLTLERDTDAFLISSHFYGDAPHLVEEGYQALIARNRPRHPAQLPAGPLEVLN